jgi:putative DNA primase/helicase
LRLADVAKTWQQNGVSVVPILSNKTKRPAVRWAEFQAQAPTLHQVDEWWGNGKSFGLALICGTVSGNLEMTEIEGRACGGDSMTEIANRMDELGVGDVWNMLTGPDGYSEMSPSGGLHLLYRISDHPVPGNTKIAQSETSLVLAETRGEGGYVIVAPTSGLCHPSGEAWMILAGRYGALPVITWELRCLIHEALRLALDESAQDVRSSLPLDRSVPLRPLTDTPPLIPTPRTDNTGPFDPSHLDNTTQAGTSLISTDVTIYQTPAALPGELPSSTSGSSAAGLSPGDHFEAVTDWAEILEPHGWQSAGRQGPERLWTRPGKSLREGHSATTGYRDDRDRMYVFSTSTNLPHEQSLTKFAVYTYLNYGGDYHVAARELRRHGFGEVARPLDVLHHKPLVEEDPCYQANDTGNSMYLADWVRGRYLFLAEEKDFLRWDGKCWVGDQKFKLENEFTEMALFRSRRAQEVGDDAGVKWWVRAGNRNRVEGALKSLRARPGFTVTAAEMDHDRNLINLNNGTYDLKSHELTPHDPDRLMTKAMGASFNPQATCPQFESFIERVLPDIEVRSYVQRALGYSLLGEADQRSLFLVCGPSGTGKSTLMATMELLFGGYGVPAPSGTLRARGSEGSSPSNDLHMLKGRRFVSTSETNEHTAYNEDLIKRLTGRDQIQSRELYQKFQTWSPRCTIWLATNHPPRFSSDDDAIWRRAKIVPFNTVLTGDGEISDFAHNVLATELDGILNWLLVGLKAYQEHGLAEPESLQGAVREVRLQSDPVARFLEEKTHDSILVVDEGQRIRTSELYAMYVEWARLVGERALGNRRFANRIQYASQDIDSVRIGGTYFWRGLGRASGVGVLGMITASVND